MKIFVIIIAVLAAAVVVWSAGQYWYVHYKIEQPEYTVVEEREGYEIREYAPYLTASVDVPDDGNALNSGFGSVADYIFGNNSTQDGSENVTMTSPVLSSTDQSENIAMTSPVLSGGDSSEDIAMTSPVVGQDNADGTRRISFVMPSKYTLETLPTPSNDNVYITEVPAQRWAVLSFSGWYNQEKQYEKRAELETMLERDGVEYTSEWQFAGYDPPSTLPFLRTNEIWIKLP